MISGTVEQLNYCYIRVAIHDEESIGTWLPSIGDVPYDQTV